MRKAFKYIVILLLFICMNKAYSQESPSDIYLDSETKIFEQIRQNAENYFADKDKGKGSGYKQWKRWEYINEHRLTPNGEITNHTLQNWLAYQEYLETNGYSKLPNPSDVTNGSWSFLAPTSYTLGAGWNPGIGRINCIAFDPFNQNIIYAGSPSGGLWKTINHGESWVNLANGIPSIGVSGIVLHPTNPEIIYILTGDGDAGDTHSIGVLKSYDGGLSWNPTGLEWDVQNLVRGYKLRMHPTNSNVLFAATNAGIYKTIDGGNSWANEISGYFFDIEFKPAAPNIMYASSATDFYRSTNTGGTWTQITNGVPTNATRTEIGVSPDDQDDVYLLCGPATGSGSFVGVYKSANSGLDFTQITNSPNILGYEIDGSDNEDQAEYDLAIAVSRTNSDNVIIGGINIWKSTNSGYSWLCYTFWKFELVSPFDYTHADIHALEINPISNALYCASDGGIYYSIDFGSDWNNITGGLSTTQFYRIAGMESNQNIILGGTQDNGTNLWTGGYSVEHILGADGMDCIIHPTSANIMLYTSQEGSLYKTWDGGDNYTEITPSGVTGSWVTPIVMDPNYSNILYGGYSDVVKSIDGGINWFNMGVDGRGAMAIGTNNSNTIYASSDNDIWRSDNGGNNWTAINAGLPDNNITFIAVDPNNSNNVFITLNGFDDGEKVYRSTSGAPPWTNITGSLPNVIVNCIAYEDTDGSPDDAIYIGTDVGVFYRDNDLGDWIPFSNYLPTVPVFDIEINETNSTMIAGTYGRGLWRSGTYSSCENELSLSGTASTGYSYYQASDFIHSTRVFNKGFGQEGYYKAGNYIKLNPGFEVSGGSKFKAFLGPCGAGIPSESSTETMPTEVKVE